MEKEKRSNPPEETRVKVIFFLRHKAPIPKAGPVRDDETVIKTLIVLQKDFGLNPSQAAFFADDFYRFPNFNLDVLKGLSQIAYLRLHPEQAPPKKFIEAVDLPKSEEHPHVVRSLLNTAKVYRSGFVFGFQFGLNGALPFLDAKNIGDHGPIFKDGLLAGIAAGAKAAHEIGLLNPTGEGGNREK